MIHIKQKFTSALVVSLLLAAISLSGTIAMAAVAPLVKAMPPVREAMITPTRMAMDSVGNFWIADYRAKSLLKYNVYGHVVKEIKVSGNPFSITVRTDGSLVVTLGNYAAIVDPLTGAETKFGLAQISKGNGVAADENGQIYISDAWQHKIHVFSHFGDYLTSFGGYALTGNTAQTQYYGFFGIPTAVAYEKETKQIAVVDSLNGRVQFFDTVTLGKFMRVIGYGKPLDERLAFVNPQGLAFEYDSANKLKRMYVVDTWKNAIQVIDPVSQKFLSLIGAGTQSPVDAYPLGVLGGVENWQMILPTDAVFDPIYKRLFVVTGTSTVQVFGIDGGKSPSDNTPHFLNINAVPLNTAQPTYTIQGTVKAGSEIKITSNTTAVAGAVRFPSAFGSTATWAADISGLALGANVLTVTATDVTGKVLTKEVTVVYSVAAPSLAINTPSGTFTNQSAFDVSGTVDLGSTVTVTNNTSGFTTTLSPAGTSWSANVALAANAANNVVVSAKKPGSNASTSTVIIINDSIPPTINLSALSENSFTSRQLQNLSGLVQDVNPGDVVTCAVSGSALTPMQLLSGGSFSIPAPLALGDNTILVQTTDKAGNVSSVTRKVTYDAATPDITITYPADNSYSADAMVTVTGSVMPSTASIAVTNSNGLAGTVTYPSAGSWSATVPMATGLNTITVTAGSGGSTSTQKRTVFSDATKTQIAVTSPSSDMFVKDATLNIVGVVSSGTDGYPVLKATMNGVPLPDAVTVDSTGHFSFPISLGTASEEKAFNIQISATDKAGISTGVTVQRNIIHDNIAPNLTIDDSGVSVPAVIGGTVDSAARVAVRDGEVSFPVVYDTSVNPVRWTAQMSQSSYNPATVEISAIDAAGNMKSITGLNK